RGRQRHARPPHREDAAMIRLDWNRLDESERERALARPAATRSAEVTESVARIIDAVRADGDAALRRLTREFDGCEPGAFEVDETELQAAEKRVPDNLKRAIHRAIDRIEAFHAAAMQRPIAVQTAPGVVCERLMRP